MVGKKILIILSLITLFSCDEQEIHTKTHKTGGEVVKTSGIFTQTRHLDEFDYKGHTYISCEVRDGISLTHAGHCKCNKPGL